MKKQFLLPLIISLTLILSFTGCSKKAATNEYGTFISMDDASQKAQKSKQNILLIVTTGIDDETSKLFVENVMASPDFKKITSSYATVNFDFSEESYKKTVVKEEATNSDNEAAEKFAEVMYENARIASLLNVQATPSVYLFTAEKYFIAEAVFENDIQTVSELEELLKSYDDTCSTINEMVTSTKKGSITERVQAIDVLFEQTEAGYRTFLTTLINQVVEIDKNNESGLVSKYIVAKANAKASDFFVKGQVNEAIICFTEAAKEKFVEPSHAQQLYYMAAYLLAMSGSTDYATMVNYLQQAVDSDPTSPTVAEIQDFMNYIQGTIAQ